MVETTALKQVLHRRDVPPGQVTLLKELYDRKDEFVPFRELTDRLGRKHHQDMKGLVMAFGVRINNTSQISNNPGTKAFLHKVQSKKRVHYQLRAEAVEAIKDDTALNQKFEEPMERLLKQNVKIER